ncbi:MAG: pentapeptide repeat-containing protein [Anaerolineales bacterium]|nr:pentapeptide repeat-containing protein [Anaerolineales bacterium]
MSTPIELINKLRSPDNKVVLQAVAELRVRGWLEDGTLKGIALCQARLAGADLVGANLNSVDLHQAQLEWADLSAIRLDQAKLTRTNLTGANFSQANLTGADLYKANLRGAINLVPAQLAQVKRLWGATMPDGQPYDGRFNLKADLDLAVWGNVDIKDPVALAVFYGVTPEVYRNGQQMGQLETA